MRPWASSWAPSLAAARGGRAGLPARGGFTGLSFSCTTWPHAVFGGLTPMLVSVWQQVDVMAPAHYVAAMGVLAWLWASGLWPARGWQSQEGLKSLVLIKKAALSCPFYVCQGLAGRVCVRAWGTPSHEH